MLAKSPVQRQQHPAQLAQQIHAILLELGSSVTLPLGPLVWDAKPQTSTWRRHLPWMIPLALLLSAIPLISSTASSTAESTTFTPLRISQPINTVVADPTRSLPGDRNNASERLSIDSTADNETAAYVGQDQRELELEKPASQSSANPPSSQLSFDPQSLNIVSDATADSGEITTSPITNFNLLNEPQEPAEALDLNHESYESNE